MADIEETEMPVQSTTEATPHPADEDSAPGPYTDLSPDRPPVSTTSATVPIAQTLVGGAGAPHDEAQVTPADDEPETAGTAEPEKRGPGRPKKEEG